MFCSNNFTPTWNVKASEVQINFQLSVVSTCFGMCDRFVIVPKRYLQRHRDSFQGLSRWQKSPWNEIERHLEAIVWTYANATPVVMARYTTGMRCCESFFNLEVAREARTWMKKGRFYKGSSEKTTRKRESFSLPRGHGHGHLGTRTFFSPGN